MWAPINGTLVIGLGHKARQGKDTAAGILNAVHMAERFAFADDLYAYCRVIHRMEGKDPRLLQNVGVYLRKGDPAVWIRAVYSKIKMAQPAIAVITDVRFPNEFEFVKALGGECWKIERWNHRGQVMLATDRPADHISEVALDSARWDRVIINADGDRSAMRKQLRDAVEDMIRRPAPASLLSTSPSSAPVPADPSPQPVSECDEVGPVAYVRKEHLRMGMNLRSPQPPPPES
jgi:hypothetical protein